jgi:NADH-quinone oxidoreductase subunit C
LAPEPEAEQAPPEEAAAEVDELRTGLVARLQAAIGDGLLDQEISGGDAWVRVAADRWRDAVQAAKDQLGLTYFCFLAGVDWMQADLLATKIWDPDADPSPPATDGPGHWTTGVAGGDTRFQVICRLYDVVGHVGLTLKADVGDDDPRIGSVTDVFLGADWHEREAWEMYGIVFDGHPGLRHLYLPGEFEGHPLRKDFPLLAREVKPWPGLVNVEGLPGEADAPEAEDESTESADA